MNVTIPLDLVLQAVLFTAGGLVIWGMMRQKVTDMQRRIGELESKHDSHVDKVDKLCNEVSALVGRFDMLFTMGKAEALSARLRP